MNASVNPTEFLFFVQEYFIGGDRKYLEALVTEYPGVVKFETGAGLIFWT